jgi:hypothetical protein
MRFPRLSIFHRNVDQTNGAGHPKGPISRRVLAIGTGAALLTAGLGATVGIGPASAVGPTIPSRSTPSTKATATTVKKSTSSSATKKAVAKKAVAKKTTAKKTTAKASTKKATTKAVAKTAAVRGDFNVSLQDESVTVAAGSSGTTRVFIDASDGFASPVTMSPREVPDGIEVRVFSPIRESARVDVSVAAGVADGSYTAQIRGTAGGKSRTADLTIVVGPGGAEPAPTDPAAGAATTTTAAIGGIARPIADPNAPTTIAGATTVPGATVPGATVPGATTTTLTGVPGATTTTVRANVPTDVVINLVPASINVSPGGTGAMTVVVAVTVATTGNLVMSTTGLPAGVTGTFAPPNLLSGIANLTLTVPATTPIGSYPFSVVATATTGGLVRSGLGTLVVGAAGAAAPTATVAGATTTIPGAATTTTIPGAAAATGDLNIVVATPSVTVQNGQSGSLTFSLSGTLAAGSLISVSGAPGNVAVSAFPNPVSSGAGSVTFFVPAGTPLGSFQIVISARNGAVVRSASAQLVIS